MNSNRSKGYIFIFLSVLIFSTMTVVVKLLSRQGVHIFQITFFRFATGFVFVWAMILLKKEEFKPVNKKALLARSVFNTLAVLLFFITIKLTNVTKGNIYNLTFPIFVALLGPYFLKEKMTLKKLAAVIIGFTGTVSVAGLNSGTFSTGDLFGISSGIVAGFAIISLRKARETDSSFTILTCLMTFGFASIGLIAFPFYKSVSLEALPLLCILGVFSFVGQYALTYGFKFISAVEGSVMSSARIFMGALLGTLFFGDMLNVRIVIGGILIFFSIVMLSLIEKKELVRNV